MVLFLALFSFQLQKPAGQAFFNLLYFCDLQGRGLSNTAIGGGGPDRRRHSRDRIHHRKDVLALEIGFLLDVFGK